MRKLSFCPILLFSTIFVYSGSALCDSTDYYEQLRKTKDLNPEKIEELKKKTVEADRISEVNKMSADIISNNKKREKETETGTAESDDNTPEIPLNPSPPTYSRIKKPSLLPESISGASSPPLKVNKADFPDDIDFTNSTPVKASPSPKK
jgi:hypothetical protein